MDEYAARVTQPLRDVWSEFQQGQATLGDLARVAGQTAMTLDNAHADLVRLLLAADSDLEYAQYAVEREEHGALAQRVFDPIFAVLDRT